jgi:hypothetical protein
MWVKRTRTRAKYVQKKIIQTEEQQ